MKQKISVMNEMKQDEKTFIKYRELSLKLCIKVAQLLAIFQCTKES
jgi:hypothetical protein